MPYDNPLNYINALFYGACPQAFSFSGLATYFVQNPLIQLTIFRHITTLFPKTELSIFEICSGTNLARWQFLSSLKTNRHWNVTLSDFSSASLPNISNIPKNPNIKYSAQVYNLLKPPQVLPTRKRYKVLLTTYGFDSVWLPQDIFLTKSFHSWYQAIFQFPPNLGSNFPQPKTLPKALSKLKYSISDLENFIPTLTYQKINISDLPFSQEILHYAQHHWFASFEYPLGTFLLIKDFLDKNLTPSGITLVGDTGYVKNLNNYPVYTTGRVGKYHLINFGLLAQMFNLSGFTAKIFPINVFLGNYGFPSADFDRSQYILQISKRNI